MHAIYSIPSNYHCHSTFVCQCLYSQHSIKIRSLVDFSSISRVSLFHISHYPRFDSHLNLALTAKLFTEFVVVTVNGLVECQVGRCMCMQKTI